MLGALTFLRSPFGMALLGAAAFVLYTGFIWIKATNAANDSWRVQMAVATEKVRQKQHARARRIEESLRVQVDLQARARAAAEKLTMEMRDAIAANQGNTTVVVSPELDRVFERTLYKGRRGPAFAAQPSGQ